MALESAGFLLIDNRFHPIYANPEGIKILGYPNRIDNPETFGHALIKRISAILPRDFADVQKSCVVQFQSGRRRYTCRAFVLENHWSGNGGPGTDAFDMLSVMRRWIEAGQAPNEVIASRVEHGKVVRTRPLCPYPQAAAYRGTGSTDDAKNFVCK